MLAPSQDTATFDMYFDDFDVFHAGELDFAKEIAAVAIPLDVIHQAGGWYSYKDYKWQGKAKILESVREDIDLRESLTKEVMDLLR